MHLGTARYIIFKKAVGQIKDGAVKTPATGRITILSQMKIKSIKKFIPILIY
jgi:hypothetical protein